MKSRLTGEEATGGRSGKGEGGEEETHTTGAGAQNGQLREEIGVSRGLDEVEVGGVCGEGRERLQVDQAQRAGVQEQESVGLPLREKRSIQSELIGGVGFR